MIEFTKLGEYGSVGIILACIGAIFWLVIKFMGHLENKDKRDAETFCRLRESIQKNTEVTNEMYTYLKMRNGSDTKRMLEEVKKYNEK